MVLNIPKQQSLKNGSKKGIEAMRIPRMEGGDLKYSFSYEDTYSGTSVNVDMTTESLTDVLEHFSNFLNACGFSYVTKVSAMYDDDSGIDSEGNTFYEDDLTYDDEEEDEEDDGDYEQK